MFQDIQPHALHIEFELNQPKDSDYLLIAGKDGILVDERSGAATLPTVGDAIARLGTSDRLIYLLSVDETAFFLHLDAVAAPDGFAYRPIMACRDMSPAHMAFAAATAAHLGSWYDTHRFCGRCATAFVHHERERALLCPACGHVEYPRISPVVIVAITDGNRLLLTKYARGYDRYALVAGFVEVGETPEDAVRREVLEEVGLHVKNIRYFKSQPWAFSGSLLAGFFADLDGSDDVRVDEYELSEGTWFDRDHIPPGESTMSLTQTMIEAFRNGEGP